jgi:hypothetical protein
LFINGAIGIDFGYHWDEEIFVEQASDSFNSGVFLPHLYIYPSFCYYLVVFAGGIYKIFNSETPINALLLSSDFYVFIRYIFLFISSLTVIWVYLLTLKITKKTFISLFAGLLFCSSFEFCYHSRWAVSDCIAVQFAFLSTLILFLDTNFKRKIIWSSLVAGIAIGTKYTAGIVCINILFYIFYDFFNKKEAENSIKELLRFVAFCFIGFIITTPGAICEPFLFAGSLIHQKNIYSTGHYGYTIQSGFPHFMKIIEYVVFVLFSDMSFVSVSFFILMVLGIIYIISKKELHVAVMFATMLIYIIFISTFKVMIVRNLLYVFPVFIVVAALGFDYLLGLIRKQYVFILKFVFVIFIGFSIISVVSSSISIYNKNKIDYAREVKNYILKNPDKNFIFSPQISSLINIKNSNEIILNNSYLIFLKDEISCDKYIANKRKQFEKVIGVKDINLDYYPTWLGSNRIIIMKNDKSNYVEKLKTVIFQKQKAEGNIQDKLSKK